MHPGLCFAAKFALTARSPEQAAFFDVADGFDPFSLFIEIAFNPAFIVHLADFEDFLADIRLGQETVGIPAVTPVISNALSVEPTTIRPVMLFGRHFLREIVGRPRWRSPIFQAHIVAVVLFQQAPSCCI